MLRALRLLRYAGILGAVGALLAGGLIWGGGSAAQPAAPAAGPRTAQPSAPRALPWPTYLADTNTSVEGDGGLQIRDSTTPAGTVAERSRVVLAHPGYRLAYYGAVINPNGHSLYLCTHLGGATTESARSQLVTYTITGMRRGATLARFTEEDSCCGTQVDPSGHWLLIPYGITAPRVSGPIGDQRRAWGGRGRLHLARINTATGARSNLTLWTPAGFGSMSPPTGMEAAW